MNVDFGEVPRPFVGGYGTPTGGIVGGTNYNYVLGTGRHVLSSFKDKVIVTGDAELIVTDAVAFRGEDFIYIAPGASLKLYVAARTAEIGGNGLINAGGQAIDFQYYGLPSNTTLKLAGESKFVGAIYAPQADLYLKGGGEENPLHFAGASVSETVTMVGEFNFHYDEALADIGPIRGYVVSAWNEATPMAWNETLTTF